MPIRQPYRTGDGKADKEKAAHVDGFSTNIELAIQGLDCKFLSKL